MKKNIFKSTETDDLRKEKDTKIEQKYDCFKNWNDLS